MKPSIGNKLAGGFGICVLMLSALAGFDFLALEKLGILYHDALLRSSGIELAADAQHIGVDLYQIIADSIINRDVSKSMQLWVDGKQEAMEKLRKMTALADTPMEHAAVADAKQALDKIAYIYEREIAPLIRTETGVSAQLTDLDDKIDEQVDIIELALKQVARSMSEENHQAERNFREMIEKAIKIGLLFSLIGVVLAGSISIFVVRRIVGALSELTRAAHEMEKGNYLVSLEYQANDETDLLANAFRRMSEEVQSHTEELRTANEYLREAVREREEAEVKLLKAHDELDAKVRDRTAELSGANELLLQEISMRRETEESLRQSEERYRSLVQATTQIVWTTNSKGEVVKDLPSWRAFTGQAEKDIKGWGWCIASCQ